MKVSAEYEFDEHKLSDKFKTRWYVATQYQFDDEGETRRYIHNLGIVLWDYEQGRYYFEFNRERSHFSQDDLRAITDFVEKVNASI